MPEWQRWVHVCVDFVVAIISFIFIDIAIDTFSSTQVDTLYQGWNEYEMRKLIETQELNSVSFTP